MRSSLAEGLAKLLKSRTVTYRDLMSRNDVRCWEFDEQRKYEFTPPSYYNNLPEEIERLVGKHTCHQPFVMEVPNVVLKGPFGQKITSDGRYIAFNFLSTSDRSYAAQGLAYDVLYGMKRGVFPEIRARKSQNLPEVDLAIPLLSKHADNYTHWAQDHLTLLQGLEEFTRRTGETPWLIIPPDPPSFIPESLEILGFDEDNWIEWNEDQDRLRVQRMVLPSVSRCLSSTSNDYFRMISSLEWLRDRVLNNLNISERPSNSTKILISREDANRRRIANRAEVTDVLTEMGFETYIPGRMSYPEQVALFANAESIVGVHGAGMVNSIYATGANILELYGNHYLPANYELAQGLGMRYGCIHCKTINDQNDLIVDIKELQNAISEIQS